MEKSKPYVDYTIPPRELDGVLDHLVRHGYGKEFLGNNRITPYVIYDGEIEVSRISRVKDDKPNMVIRTEAESRLDEVLKGFLFSSKISDALSGRNPNILLCMGGLSNVSERRPSLTSFSPRR